ncbi:hypothetical protein EC957_009627 [Mortierella hygrophila]|uniref:Phosphatidylglycerol/phosphatidylinositol transfer protein n=1 Tax=Mortierella hygrophila TaxID=979708 RepID=A0A9P6K522_9FUNG|nr:hypothetical protein EC957_009627 [Mortierella hygrophila]
MKFIAAVAAILVAAVANAQVPFTNCATGPTQIAIDNFSISPYPLCINQNVCAEGTGTLSTPVIEGATLSITGRYLGRLVYTDNHDLCALMATQGQPCPILTNVNSIKSCVNVKPSAPPNIAVALQVSAINGDGGTLFCQAATVTAKTC